MIPYHEEPGPFSDIAEPCCFCREPTRCWTSLPERKESEQVACCALCSREKRPVQVPGKRAWLDLVSVAQWMKRRS